jgi:hypothetical protein
LRSGSAALVTGFRTAAVQTVAALGAGVALLYTAGNYRLSRRGQVTDRFTKALERLGSDEKYVRLGGILALEQIVQDAPEQATHAAQVLNAFILERAPRRQALLPTSTTSRLVANVRRRARSSAQRGHPDRPDEDVQAALIALTRPESRRFVDPSLRIDLRGLHLENAWLIGADLSGAMLDGVNLSGAVLNRADLTNARLRKADLRRARVIGTILQSARIAGADLNAAQLLTPEQVGSAYLDRSTILPEWIAADPRVVKALDLLEKRPQV